MAGGRHFALFLPGAILATGVGLLAFDPGDVASTLRDGTLTLYTQLDIAWNGESAARPQVVRADWASWVEVAFLFVSGAGLIALLARAKLTQGIYVASAAIVIGLGGSWSLYTYEGLFLDPSLPALALVLAAAAAAATSYLKGVSARRRVHALFGTQLSPALISQIAANPLPLNSGDQTKTITYLSCQLLGAAKIGEVFENQPVVVTALIREFRSRVADAIMENGGTLDRQMGARIAGFWNAPTDDPEHARKASKAALAVLEGLPSLERIVPDGTGDKSGEQTDHLKIGLGINTGRSIVGNIAHDGLFDYAAVGEVADHAARLHRQSENYGLPIIVAEETRKSVSDLPLIELDRVTVISKKDPIKIYGLLQPHQVSDDSAYQAHQLLHGAMLHAYRQQNWQEAKDYLTRCQGFCPDLDNLYDLYASRIEFYDSAPPGSGWDGTLTATRR